MRLAGGLVLVLMASTVSARPEAFRFDQDGAVRTNPGNPAGLPNCYAHQLQGDLALDRVKQVASLHLTRETDDTAAMDGTAPPTLVCIDPVTLEGRPVTSPDWFRIDGPSLRVEAATPEVVTGSPEPIVFPRLRLAGPARVRFGLTELDAEVRIDLTYVSSGTFYAAGRIFLPQDVAEPLRALAMLEFSHVALPRAEPRLREVARARRP